MPGTRQSRRFDRRRSARKSERIRALVGAKSVPAAKCENALIEEIGPGGMRIVSGAPLNPDDSFVLFVGDEARPLQAKVMWVRKQGVIEKRRTGKPGQAFLAGVKVRKQEQKPKEKLRGAARAKLGSSDVSVKVFRGLVIAGALGGVGLLGYALYSLIGLIS